MTRETRETEIPNLPVFLVFPVLPVFPKSGRCQPPLFLCATSCAKFFATFGGKSGAKATHHISGGVESRKA